MPFDIVVGWMVKNWKVPSMEVSCARRVVGKRRRRKVAMLVRGRVCGCIIDDSVGGIGCGVGVCLWSLVDSKDQ